jgi:hypothetical protein
MRLFLPLLIAAAALSGCSKVGGPYPSLQPRSAETIDPRLPVAPLSSPAAVSAGLAGQLGALVSQARAGDSAFRPAMAQAERLARSAATRQSESWILAQQALSAAAAARGPTTRALGDVDALAATQLEQAQTIPPADLAAVSQAAAAISSIAAEQQARIDAVARRLGA